MKIQPIAIMTNFSDPKLSLDLAKRASSCLGYHKLEKPEFAGDIAAFILNFTSETMDQSFDQEVCLYLS